MILQGGLDAIRMDAIAKEMKVTRGTLYNHFPNREDIVLSLAARAVERRLAIFRFAITLGDITRKRIAAIGLACEVYADHLPDDFAVEQMIRHDSVWAKTSDGRREQLQCCEHGCFEILGQVMGEAVATRDLKLERNQRAEDILLGLWSLIYGGLLIEKTSPSLSELGISDARAAIRRNCNAMLDGLNWEPLYAPSTYRRWVNQMIPKLKSFADSIEQKTSKSNHLSTSKKGSR